jgi:hypothetical protein
VSIPDLINGCFEFGGALFIIGHIRKLYADKLVRGVYWPATLWFASWGWWNVYYYAHLDQWLSWTGGLFIVTFNTIWTVMLVYYIQKEKWETTTPEGMMTRFARQMLKHGWRST